MVVWVWWLVAVDFGLVWWFGLRCLGLCGWCVLCGFGFGLYLLVSWLLVDCVILILLF